MLDFDLIGKKNIKEKIIIEDFHYFLYLIILFYFLLKILYFFKAFQKKN